MRADTKQYILACQFSSQEPHLYCFESVWHSAINDPGSVLMSIYLEVRMHRRNAVAAWLILLLLSISHRSDDATKVLKLRNLLKLFPM